MTVTLDYEIEFGGVKIADGNTRQIVMFAPFESPEIRSSDTARGQQDGLFAGSDLYGGRTIEMELELWAENSADFYTAYTTVMNACVKGIELPLEFKLPGWSDNLIAYARCRKVSGLVVDQLHDLNKGTCVLQFTTTDPRLYSASQSSAVVALAGSQPGRTYSRTYSRSYGGIVTSNIINATNAGNYDAPWEARIDGPVTNPRVENADTGQTITLNATIAAGEFVVVSSAPYSTVMLAGTSTRYLWLAGTSEWFMLAPGNNSIRFGGTSAGAPTMTFTWRSAWV